MVSWLAWAGVLVGAVLVGRGIVQRTRTPAVMGAALVAYGLTLRTYAPLGSISHRHPLTTDDRVWGATWAVMGGWAITALLLAVVWSHRSGAQRWTGPQLSRQLAVLSASAVVSAIVLRGVWLFGPSLAPSANFLNDYGSDGRVVVYQLLFAVWLGAPLGALGVATWLYRRGPARWITIVGCVFGVFWAAWKIFGTIARLIMGERIAMESPVSVATGAVTLLLVIGGLLIGVIQHWIGRAHAHHGYKRARQVDDDQHYTREDSTDSSAA